MNKIEEIQKAFSPDNLQWLSMEENRSKGGKILKGSYLEKNMVESKIGGNIKSLISA